MPPDNQPIIFEGLLSVRAAIESTARTVRSVLISHNLDTHRVRRLINQAKARHIEVLRRSTGEIDAISGGKSHGGVVALVGRRCYVSLDQLASMSRVPLLVCLDGVEDPYNFGQSIRAIYAAGCDGLIVGPRNWESAEATVARASAGASELIPTARVQDIEQACADLADRGFSIAMTAHEPRAPTIYGADLTGPLVIVLGGERRGVKRSLRHRANRIFSVPYGRDFDASLGTTAATATVVFEAMRQRRNKANR